MNNDTTRSIMFSGYFTILINVQVFLQKMLHVVTAMDPTYRLYDKIPLPHFQSKDIETQISRSHAIKVFTIISMRLFISNSKLTSHELI